MSEAYVIVLGSVQPCMAFLFTWYLLSVRNFLHEVAAVLPCKNKYIYATLDTHQDWDFFSLFRHYFAHISSDSSFSS